MAMDGEKGGSAPSRAKTNAARSGPNKIGAAFKVMKSPILVPTWDTTMPMVEYQVPGLARDPLGLMPGKGDIRGSRGGHGMSYAGNKRRSAGES